VFSTNNKHNYTFGGKTNIKGKMGNPVLTQQNVANDY